MPVRVGSIGAVYYGLSTDTKPTISNGHLFLETDTNDLYARINSVWRVINRTAIEYVIGDGNGTITVGVWGDAEVPFNCTIIAARLFADQSGSIVVAIWRDTFANYPPTSVDTITASARPTLSAAQASQDTTLTGWTTALVAGDTLRYNVVSVTSVRRVLISLLVRVQ